MTFLRTAMPLRQVDSLAPGGPADVSKKVQPGDRLITINGKSIKGLDARSGHDPYAFYIHALAAPPALLVVHVYAVCGQTCRFMLYVLRKPCRQRIPHIRTLFACYSLHSRAWPLSADA
jgi:hypothetical protein